jgi:hypothetical protein
MTRSRFVATYLVPSTASTVATRRATEQEKKVIASERIDWHADRATERE